MNEDSAKKPFRPESTKPAGGDAYDQLAEFGFHYDSGTPELHRAGLAAQRAGKLSADRRAAWAELRDPVKRLLLDLQYFQPDPGAFGEQPGGLVAEPTPACPEIPPVADPDSLTLLAAAEGLLEFAATVEDTLVAEAEVPDPWAIMAEAWTRPPEELPPFSPPNSFLEEGL